MPPGPIPETELELRRRWYQAHVARCPDKNSEPPYWPALREKAPEVRQIFARLEESADIERFLEEMRGWASDTPGGTFHTRSGQMFLTQLVNRARETNKADDLTECLVDCAEVPMGEDDAQQKIQRLVQFTDNVRKSRHPERGRVPFFLSFLWAVQDFNKWPMFWGNSIKYLEALHGKLSSNDPAERYLEFQSQLKELDPSPARFEVVYRWWMDQKIVLLDPVMCKRCSILADDKDGFSSKVLVAFARHISRQLYYPIRRELDLSTSDYSWRKNWVLANAETFAEWRVKDGIGVAIRVWLNSRGAAIGLRVYGSGHKDHLRALSILDDNPIEGYEWLAGSADSPRDGTHGFVGGDPGECMYGRWYEKNELSTVDVKHEVLEAASHLAKLLGEPDQNPLTDPEAVRPPDPEPAPTTDRDLPSLEERLDNLAEKLLIGREFLTEIVGLLEDKGQVIFYGPPGTGKTYLAVELAKVLAPDERHKIVQFHPSMSYEDFFEGYRPVPSVEGQVGYELTEGPLLLLASAADTAKSAAVSSAGDSASQADGGEVVHVLVIDEINRANLPRVFGELLFLLEYRDEEINPLYRPEETFKLPENLWFIGTMNTADRSIALVDVALRRRFHFVPFFPNDKQGPVHGLLRRWLEKNSSDMNEKHRSEMKWVADLVDAVNGDLMERLRGGHLQIGPSHFMKQDLDEAKIKSIWRYNIEPLIEDQFFGNQEEIRFFSFEEVSRRHGQKSSSDDLSAQVENSDGTKDGDTAGAGPGPPEYSSSKSEGD